MEATSCRLRLRSLLRALICSRSSRIQLQRPRLFSSSSGDSACRSQPFLFDDPEERRTGSEVYRHTLKTQRPSTIRWRKELVNSVSFVGTVNRPLKTFTTTGGNLCAHTHLKVESPPGSNKFLTILLEMWREMAELSIQHLKPNDHIYVSGYLGSFTKAYDNGNIRLNHKVTVKEINYVANKGENSKNIGDWGESALEKRRNRHHLWQVFFASPHEWQDLRKCKVNPRQPDFKHKGTGEALWLEPYDPPWISKQLQLQDSRMGDMDLGRHTTYHSNLSPLIYDS